MEKIEEEVKGRIGDQFFHDYDWQKKLANIDFWVRPKTIENEDESRIQNFVWAEAKKGNDSNLINSFIQLIITIGKAYNIDKTTHLSDFMPPLFLAAFDEGKIAFIKYECIQYIFTKDDVEWNVTPSNYETDTFKQLKKDYEEFINKNIIQIFHFESDNKILSTFISKNFKKENKNSLIQISKNNYLSIFHRWQEYVKPYIEADWDKLKEFGFSDADFFLADTLSEKNKFIDVAKDLSIRLCRDHYEYTTEIKGLFNNKIKQDIAFKDNQIAHSRFWNIYERPPKKEFFRTELIRLRDNLLPKDIRERKGAFFTPDKWVEKSQKYIGENIGDNWQNEYYIWDCCGGTGNLEKGLTNSYNIWVSTLFEADVNVIKDRINTGELNLVENHIFKFDFLNDEFQDIPDDTLKGIINDPQKRRKLIIYINPPYAEASDYDTTNDGEAKKEVEQSKTNDKYSELLGQANAEIYSQFLMRICQEIPGCIIAEFSTLKILQGPHFNIFRKNFHASLCDKMFIVPAESFLNVKGKFPIGFMVWKTSVKEGDSFNSDFSFEEILSDVFDKNGDQKEKKKLLNFDTNYTLLNEWIKLKNTKKSDENVFGKFPLKGNDIQNSNMVLIVHKDDTYNKAAGQFYINKVNFEDACVYYAVRKSIDKTWINDRDQFIYPSKEEWKKDEQFINNCIIYSVFENRLKEEYYKDKNQWIAFNEDKVKPSNNFNDNLVYKYISGSLDLKVDGEIQYGNEPNKSRNVISNLSEEAKNVYDSAAELFHYYHKGEDEYYSSKKNNPFKESSLFQIKAFFQGIDKKGHLKRDENQNKKYTTLINAYNEKVRILRLEIAEKVRNYGFLIN